jgi:hypothetical protein
MQTAQGNLVMVGLNTPAPQVFWNGAEVQGITGIRVDWENDEQRIKLKVNGTDEAMYSELALAGVTIKKVV